MGLLDAFKQYVRDAMPGGLLNSEWTPDRVRTAAEVASMEPGLLGSAASAGLAVDDLRQGNYGDAALNGLGLLPFVPAMGGTMRLGQDGRRKIAIGEEGKGPMERLLLNQDKNGNVFVDYDQQWKTFTKAVKDGLISENGVWYSITQKGKDYINNRR